MDYFKKIPGEKVYLSPVSPADYEKCAEWLNDFEITMNLAAFSASVLSKSSEREALERMSRDADNCHFSIIDAKTDRLLGNCGLINIDMTNRKADLGIFIGEKSCWGKGYGAEAVELLLDFAFSVKNLNSVMLQVAEFNSRAIRCYEKCGFKKIGVRRESWIFGGEKFATVMMDILASEFKGKFFANRVGKIKSAGR